MRACLLLLTAFLLLVGCDAPPPSGCEGDTDCANGQRCIDATCIAPEPERDAGPVDAGCGCAPGELCTAGRCALDCASPDAVPCAAGDVCDIGSGACVAEGTPNILVGDGERCGEEGPRCLPGTECTLDGRCLPAPPCASMGCTDDGSTCWGRSCVTTRPAGVCAPPTLERMREDDFLLGAVDLEFDDVCNAYAVTTLSGPDYLRELTPEGILTVSTGVTNLNMGEVAVLRRPGGEFGDGALGEAALTYVCCAACGCVTGDDGDPQGVARLDREGAERLPMVVIALPSAGDGPFGDPIYDTGPFGLTWGRDRSLYVGNVTAQGDLVRADLTAGTSDEIARFDARIHASANFGRESLLVALAGGAIHRVSIEGAASALWADVGADVTGLVRDPFTGRVYVAVFGGRILELDRDGTILGELDSAARSGRLAYAPDGFLYHLAIAPAELTRYPLPTSL